MAVTMTTPATTTAPVAITGLVSGLDTTSIVSKLVDLEKRPITLIQNKQSAVNDQITAWQDFNTKLLALNTSVNNLNTSAKFKSITGAFTNSVANGANIVSLTTTSAAASGTYNITVSHLAAQQKTISDTTWNSLNNNSGIGSMTITKADGTSTTVTGTSLSDYVNAINNSGIGVSASAVDTSASSTPAYKLVLNGNATGAANSFTVTASGAGAGPGNLPAATFTTTQQAADASITVDGMNVSRSNNTFVNVINGVTMNITGTGSGQLAFSADTASIVNNVSNFITAYNDTMDFINTQMTYNKNASNGSSNSTNPATGTAAAQQPLFGNSTLLSIQQTLRSIVSGPVAGLNGTNNAGINSLSQVGIKTDNSNHLTMDSPTFTAALQSNPTAVTNLFSPAASGTYSFVMARGSVVGGAYDTQYVTDPFTGVTSMQMRRQGSTGSWITLTQSGNFFDGPAGSDLEGFTMMAPSTLAAGQTGTMNISVGIGERVAYQTGYYTEYSNQGLIYNEQSSLQKNYTDLQGQIDDLNQRVQKKSDDLTAKYARLETILATLKSQGDYLSQQLATLPNTMAMRGTLKK